MITTKGKVLKSHEVYARTGEPLGNGPRCSTCGDLAAWGTHPLCKRGSFGRLLVWETTL